MGSNQWIRRDPSPSCRMGNSANYPELNTKIQHVVNTDQLPKCLCPKHSARTNISRVATLLLIILQKCHEPI